MSKSSDQVDDGIISAIVSRFWNTVQITGYPEKDQEIHELQGSMETLTVSQEPLSYFSTANNNGNRESYRTSKAFCRQ